MLKDTDYNENMRFTLESTESDLPPDVASTRADLPGLLDSGLPSLSATAFFQFLKGELDRANRYSFLVSLLLLRILPGDEVKCPERAQLGELAYLLNATLRTTDFLGSLGDGMVGVIAPHSDLDTAARLLHRLQAESMFAAFRRRTGCDLRAAFSIYPTDATTISSLFHIALERMR